MAALVVLLAAHWVRRRDRAYGDVALLFWFLALAWGLALAGRGLPMAEPAAVHDLATAFLLVFPLLLLRVVAHFRPVPWTVWAPAGLAGSALIAYLAASAAGVQPAVPGEQHLGNAMRAYMILVAFYAGQAFVRGALRARGVAKKRMSLAAAGIILVAAAAVAVLVPTPPAVRYVVSVAGLLLLYLAFAPPSWLLGPWQAQEMRSFLAEGTGKDPVAHARDMERRLCRTADRMLGATGSLLLLSEGTRTRIAGPDTDAKAALARDAGLLDALLETRVTTTLRQNSHWPRLFSAFGSRTVSVVPVGAGTVRRGVLLSPFHRPPMFLPATLNELQILAEQVAQARRLAGAAARQRRLQQRQHEAEREVLLREKRSIEHANRLKTEFLANTSHELRTPLNSILGFGRLLEQGMVGPDKTREFAGDIVSSGQHLLQIINDILDLAKVEAGKLVLEPQDVDMADVVDEVISTLHAPLAESGNDIQVEVTVRAAVLDRLRLKQVLYNYLSNAIKFTSQGNISVRVRPDAHDRLRIEVEDTGIGIPPEDQERVFQEFEQAGRPGALHGGTGLGLALVKSLVEAQGGEVGVESKRGRGSLFFAVLPRWHGAGGRPVPLHAGPRVLVVGHASKDVPESLRRANYVVEAVATMAEARPRLAAARYDAVVLDVAVPDGGGLELVSSLRLGDNERTPVVVTAPDGAGPASPVAAYLCRTVDPEAVVAALQDMGVRRARGPVLVVDDEEPTRRLLSFELTRLGIPSRTAGGTLEAMAQVKEEVPSVVVLDLVMPGADGFAFLQWLRSSPGYQSIPVVVWTQKDLSREEREMLAASAQKVLQKAQGPQDLLTVIEETLRRGRRPARRRRVGRPEGTRPAPEVLGKK